VTGYRVYYGQVSGSYATVKPDAPSLISGTTYTTPDLPAGTYYFAVKAFDSAGNSSGYSNQVSTTITATVAAPTANFSANKTTGSAPLTINFTDGSTGSITGWSWNFGDGTTSTAQNPSKTYSSAGAYTVKLTVTGSGGSNTATKTNYITVTTPTATAPVASFTAGPASGSAPLLVTFTDTSVGSVTRRSWNFGDGTTSTAQNPVKTYNAPGTYTAKLTVGNSSGITSATKTISATAIAPVASFSASPRSGAAPLAVSFTNTSTGTITSYSWTFGDGGTSTASNPTYTYTKAGTYTVSLATTGPAGSNTKTLVNHITVSAAQAGGGLVAAYNFEETSGATVVDISGNSNHGTISGATRTTSGKYGKALSFDGASNWVTVNDSASLDLTTSVTVEAWIYPNNLDSGWWYCVLAKDHSGGASYYLALVPIAINLNLVSELKTGVGINCMVARRCFNPIPGYIWQPPTMAPSNGFMSTAVKCRTAPSQGA
jgi:PKD repeat protein